MTQQQLVPRRADLVAARAGALAGLAAAAVFGLAHGLFIAWVPAPFVAGAVMGGVVGALCGVVLARSGRRVSPLRLGLLLVAIALPLGIAAFLLAPAVGSPSWLVQGTLVLSVLAGAAVGRALRAPWWGIVVFAAVGFVVGGPGEPFIHEGPKPHIVGFYGGLLLALGVAGFAAETFLRMRLPSRAVPGESSSHGEARAAR